MEHCLELFVTVVLKVGLDVYKRQVLQRLHRFFLYFQVFEFR